MLIDSLNQHCKHSALHGGRAVPLKTTAIGERRLSCSLLLLLLLLLLPFSSFSFVNAQKIMGSHSWVAIRRGCFYMAAVLEHAVPIQVISLCVLCHLCWVVVGTDGSSVYAEQ